MGEKITYSVLEIHARRMRELIESKKLRQKLGTSGRNYIIKKFNDKKVVEDYLKFFNNKLNNV